MCPSIEMFVSCRCIVGVSLTPQFENIQRRQNMTVLQIVQISIGEKVYLGINKINIPLTHRPPYLRCTQLCPPGPSTQDTAECGQGTTEHNPHQFLPQFPASYLIGKSLHLTVGRFHHVMEWLFQLTIWYSWTPSILCCVMAVVTDKGCGRRVNVA